MHTIQNEWIKVGIKPKGAELASIQSLENNKEYLWQADPTFWGRHSCILFPIIGEVSDGYIDLNGKPYQLGRHGFLRDCQFTIQQEQANQVTFSFSSNPESIKIYPFHFEFKAIYTIEKRVLTVLYSLTNTSEQALPFSLGAHPGFNCPLESDEKRADYALVFNQKETAHSQLLNEEGLRKVESKLVLDNSDTLTISDDLFDEDALIFKNLKSHSVQLVNQKKAKTVLSFDFTGFPYLGIWSKNQQSPFVCIEPWYGVADSAGPRTEFREKEGVIEIGRGATFECSHQIEIHP